MAAGDAEATMTSDREITVTRVFDAPRELVFEAWTDPEQVVQWWGPHGFTTTVHEMDVRPGGVWRFVMHGPDGTDYDNKVVFMEVEPSERLFYTHSGGEDSDSPAFQVTVTFEEEGDKTRLTTRMVFASGKERDRMIEEVGALEGVNQTLDRLGAYLGLAG
ncbi:MAG: ATPase [Chloroflexi bacterium]|nr:MAG: ATPase [Chloroflexota bacterium]